MRRFPSKSSSLRFLRECQVPVGAVLDVGAHEQTQELREIFPDVKHLLFEPATEFHDALHRNYANVDHEIVSAALSDRDGHGYLHKVRIDGAHLSHAMLVDPSLHDQTDLVATMRLDTFMKDQEVPKPYLLKIDVDGFEIPIVRGASGIMVDVSCVIIEATLDTLVERLNFVVSKGFKLFDIVDQCYYYGMFSQVDLIFVAERFFELPALQPWKTKDFSWSEWITNSENDR